MAETLTEANERRDLVEDWIDELIKSTPAGARVHRISVTVADESWLEPWLDMFAVRDPLGHMAKVRLLQLRDGQVEEWCNGWVAGLNIRVSAPPRDPTAADFERLSEQRR